MLVLTRKRTEMINIGEDIVITVIHTSHGSVKLGIQAPSHVRVLRAELAERPAVTSMPAKSQDADHEAEGPVFSAELFLNQFNADYVADLEDQALLSLAK